MYRSISEILAFLALLGVLFLLLIITGCFENSTCNSLLKAAIIEDDREVAANKAHNIVNNTLCFKEIKAGIEDIGYPESDCPTSGVKQFNITKYVYKSDHKPITLIDGNIELIGIGRKDIPRFPLYDGAGNIIQSGYKYWSYQGKRWDDDLSMWKVMWKLKVNECKGREVKRAWEVHEQLARGSIDSRFSSSTSSKKGKDDNKNTVEGTVIPPVQ